MRCRWWLFLALALALPASAEVPAFGQFHEANQAFDKGDYEAAEKAYRGLIGQGFVSSDLHYNLANAYFKRAQLGNAIFHYRKALELAPRDPDIAFNLNYARERVTDRVESSGGIGLRVANALAVFSEKEIYYALLCSSLAWAAMLWISFFSRQEWIKWIRGGMLGTLIISASYAGYGLMQHQDFAVVQAKEAKVFSGIGVDNVVLFTVHEGVELVVADAVGADWIRMRLQDGKQGWIKTENIVWH